MGTTRAPYPAAFRQQMVELVESGRRPADLAREFDVSAWTVANRLGQAAVDRGKRAPGKQGALTSVQLDALARLRRKNRRLQTERDVLANSSA